MLFDILQEIWFSITALAIYVDDCYLSYLLEDCSRSAEVG